MATTETVEAARSRKARVFAELKEIAHALIMEGRALMNAHPESFVFCKSRQFGRCSACDEMREKLDRGRRLVNLGADVMILRGQLFKQVANNRYRRLTRGR